MRTRQITSLLVLGLLLGAGSCQRGPGPIAAVSGRITYNGAPLINGTIVFVPDASKGEHGSLAVGMIAPDGSYTLKTGEASGAPAGWYKVTVSSLANPYPQAGQSFNFPQSIIPEKYRDPEQSALVCEVKAHQTNTIDLHLK